MVGAVFAAMFILLILAVPICVVIPMISLIPYGIDATFAASPMFILRNMVSGLDSITLIAIPMFVLSGIIMARGGISKKLFNVFSYFIGDKTGGLPCAVVVTCLFYGAISGSAPATTAAVGAMTIPLLVSLGYDLSFCAALVAISGGLGVIIPPSVPFILYSMNSGASVGELFTAGILPGILIGIFLMAYAVYFTVITNNRFFEELPAEYQSWITEACDEVLVSSREASNTANSEQAMADAGVEVIHLSDEVFQQISHIMEQEVWPMIRADVGDELMDALLGAVERAEQSTGYIKN